MFEALDIVSREIVGAIPASTLDAKASGVSIGDKVKVPLVPEMETEDALPSATKPSGNGQNFGSVEISITKSKRAKPILWTGEDENRAKEYIDPLKRNQFSQAFRAVINEMEMDVVNEAVKGAMASGNIIGTAGVNPFATDLKPLTLAYKMLEDNGAPLTDLQFVMNTTSGMNMRNLTQLQKVGDAGDSNLLRRGVLGNLFNFNIRESGGFKQNAKGSVSTDYLVNGGASKGDKEVTVDTGVGTIKAGNIITFGSDTVKYSVAEDVESGSTKIILDRPLEADVADNAKVNVGDSYLANVAFTSGSIILANRLPFVPEGGDDALDRFIMTEPVSGIPFEIALWGGAYQNSVTVTTCWGVKNIKGEHTIALIG